jgi:ATP-dependent exoDNAse (exonuclease V) beta subunit
MKKQPDFLAKIKQDFDLVDGQARYEAIDPGQSFIVQAPAGSGKTALLTQRYLALLAVVDSPEKIVAMTYTKKAASEMRQRILEALKEVNNFTEESIKNENLYQQNTWHLATEALKANNRQGWGLLENPKRLRVKTIDSFNSYLVQQMPLLSRFGSQPGITQNAEALYLQAAREVLNEPSVVEQSLHLTALLNGNRKAAEKMIANMLAKRDQWMPLLQVSTNQSDKALNLALQKVVLAEFQVLLLDLQPIMQYLLNAKDILIQVLAPSSAELDSLFALKINSKMVNDFKVEDSQAFKVLAKKLLTTKGDLRKTVDKRSGFPVGSAEEKELKKEFLQCLENIATADIHGKSVKALAKLAQLPYFEYSESQLTGIHDLFILLKNATAFLKIIFSQQGETDFIEISQAASASLGEKEEPTDLAQRLDYQIEHLLIDEFQDTSVSQYLLLKKLIAGWSKEDNHSLFIVGDPMQSIYRFREAEVANFLDAWRGKIEQFPLKKLNLSINFRSSSSVVDWVNNTFAEVMPKQSEIAKGAVSYTKAEAFSNDEFDNEAVQLNWSVNQPKQEQIIQLADDVCACLTNKQSEQKIGVLARTKSVLTPLAKELKNRGIPFKAVELERLNNQQEIQDLEALTKALLHLGDKGAWIALLRSPAIGLSLADLAVLLENKTEPVWQILQQHETEKFVQLSSQGQAILNSVLAVLTSAINHVGIIKWSRLIKETWLALDMPQALSDSSQIQNVEAFWQMLARLEQSKTGLTQLELDKTLQDLFSLPDDSPESHHIELMSIHKSKGLEFDFVFLPELNKSAMNDDKELVSWLYFQQEGVRQVVFAPMAQRGKKAAEQDTSLVSFLQGFEKEKHAHELDRLFYVACTRAKQNLFLYANITVTEKNFQQDKPATVKEDSLFNCIWHLQQEMVQPLLQNLLFESKDIAEKEPVFLVKRLAENDSNRFANFPKQEVKKYSHLNSQNSILQSVPSEQNLMVTEVGNLVHAFLEVWGLNGLPEQLSKDQLGIIKQQLMSKSLVGESLVEAEKRVIKSLSQAIKNPKIVWALSAERKQASCELELTSRGMVFDDAETSSPQQQVLQQHIVDRTFVDDNNVRWIVDYKTSYWDESFKQTKTEFITEQVAKYQPQLARYGSLLKTLDGREQCWILYFSYLDEWVEVSS